MQKTRFKTWMASERKRKLNDRTVSSRMSDCERVEEFEGDLDDHFDTDELGQLIERLAYTKEDERHGREPKHNVPISGDIYNVSATLKSAVKLYREFRRSARLGWVPDTQETAAGQRPLPQQGTSRPDAQWPQWPQPTDEVLFKLAQVLAPLVRFLDPAIIGAIAEDNRRHQDEWSARLDLLGIHPAIYLWDGSPCVFPGVRRYAGSTEIAWFRKRSPLDAPPAQCLTLDDNDYPKHLWAFVFTGRPFRKQGPGGYQLAHLLDHKAHGNRWQEELDGSTGAVERTPLFGLFTSAANTAYLPATLLRPTDFSYRLRTLLQRRALALYGNVCRMVPPSLEIRACDNPRWLMERFDWSEPVGDMAHLPAFLAFRRERMNRLIELRRAGPPRAG